MKRILTFAVVGAVGAVLVGCPLYSSFGDDWCTDPRYCQPGQDCYQWPCGYPPPYRGAGGTGGSAVSDGSAGTTGDAGPIVNDAAGAGGSPDAAVNEAGPPDAGAADAPGEASSAVYCGKPGDCATGMTCGADGTCRAGKCNLTGVGCVNGYVCTSVKGIDVCVRADPNGCGTDADCIQPALCVDGVCTDSSELCTDGTQCTQPGKCVDGKCVKACSATLACPAGFLCRLDLGICDIPDRGCGKTADCGGPSTVCVDHACVPRCFARGACSGNTRMCVDNGCVPTQKIVTECPIDGQPGACPVAGQICVHKHCYVSCAAEAASVCESEPVYTTCKAITTRSDTFPVCGSQNNLGSQCDLTTGKPCSLGEACIDGFCKIWR